MDTTEIINASISAGYVGLFAVRKGKSYEPKQTMGSKVDDVMKKYYGNEPINDAEVLG